MATFSHVLHIRLFIIVTWLYFLSIVLTAPPRAFPSSVFTSTGISKSSLQALMVENSFKSSFDSGKIVGNHEIKIPAKNHFDPLASSENFKTLVAASATSPATTIKIYSSNRYSANYLRRKMMMKRTMMKRMMMTKRRKRSNEEPVVKLKSQLYSVCSRSFVQIQGTQVNAQGLPGSPQTRLEIISEPRPSSVNLDLTSFQNSDQRLRPGDTSDSISFYVKVKSSTANRFICFNSVGNVISKISGQNARCRMTEVSHNGAFYYRSAVNNSWFLQFNHRGHRIKITNSHNRTTKHNHLTTDSETTPTSNRPNCSDSSVSSLLPSTSSSLTSSSSPPSSSSSSSSPPPSLLTSSLSSSSTDLGDVDQRHLRRYRKYSRCQGFIKIPLTSSLSSPSLNFKSVK